MSRFHHPIILAIALAWPGAATAHDMPGPMADSADADPDAYARTSASADAGRDTAFGDSLPALVARALARSPALRAADREVRSRHSGPGHVWALDPPEVGVEFYQGPARDFPNPLKRQQEIDYMVDQAFPFPGTLGARIRAEHGHAEAGEAELEALRRRTVRDVKAGYYAAWLAGRRLALNARGRALAERLTAIARRQYEVGLGSQSDILRSQAEATRLRMDSADLEQARAAALADLNALIDRDPRSPLALPDSLEPRAEEFAYERLEAAVAAAHPDLKAKSAEIRMRRAEGDLARRAYWPSFKVGGTYKDMRLMPEGGHGGTLKDYWSLRLGMDVPVALWSLPRARAGAAQARANLEGAQAEYAAARNAALARALAAAERARALRVRLKLAREALLPQARQAYASALAGYQGGKEGFAAVLDAYRAALDAEAGEAADLAALLAGQADLEEAAGMDWGALALPREGGAR